MNVNEMETALDEAQRTLSGADRVAGSMARMLVGRLRRVNYGWVLSDLKRELRDYNTHTGTWRER